MMYEEPSAAIHEVFSGIQGEGMLVGARQIFVRFHGCNLDCAFCDTPASRGDAPATCAVETAAGSRQLESVPNPLAVHDLLGILAQLQDGYPHHSVSLTGGEPLLHGDFLARLLPFLNASGLRSYLETNGVCAQELSALEMPSDFVAMDMKLPSTAGGEARWDEHADFLDAAVQRLASWPNGLTLPERLQVKLVFGERSLEEVLYAARLIAARRRDIPCILQPVTPHPGGPDAPSAAVVLEAQRLAATVLDDVRVIPQTHVMLGQW